jgi:predicted phage terminase large subunit-like protein
MSASSAILQTENLKRELVSNKQIEHLFGKMKTRNASGIDESFSKAAWVAKGNTMVYPRGSGQQIRGILYKNFRPDLFVVDDLEDPETIENEDIRRKRKEWFNADLLKATSRVDKNYQIVYIDTLKHEDALLEDLLSSSMWESIRQEICDDDLNSNAPSFISNEEIEKEYSYYKEQGILDVFYREYRNMPISTHDAVFKAEYFKYFEPQGNDLLIHTTDPEKPKIIPGFRLTNVVIVDPAKTVKLQSADSAAVVVGLSREDQKVFFRDYISGKMYPDELYDAMFQLVRDYKAQILAVEVTSLHAFISQPIENEMRKRGIYPMYHELKAVGKKEERVAMMSPYYRQGYIYHNQNNHKKLENQLMGFPRSKLWDVMDAFAYFVKLYDEMAYYFDPADDFEDDEDDFDSLEEYNEAPIRIPDLTFSRSLGVGI